jgi:hypothetical protein
MVNDTEPYSDDESKFGEDRRKPIPHTDINAKLVMTAADILREGVPCTDHSG